MYYIIYALNENDSLSQVYGGTPLISFLSFGMVILAFFASIFLFYTNSFLMKRRKKEFGLYNILGMEKRHVFKTIFFEVILVSIFSLVIGILSGVVLSKLFFLLLLRIVHFDTQLGVEISLTAIGITILLFSAIFFLSYLNTLRQIHISKPVELLKGGQIGEREPKTKWIMTISGCISLAAGYYIALTTTSPLDAISLFFLAVLFVIIGTYLLFTTGSITLLKLLRKNKTYYYKTNHFVSVSSMIYRMKQNAVGLSNICILSTAVLVMLSTTVCLYVGTDDGIRTRFPRNVIVSSDNVSKQQVSALNDALEIELETLSIEVENVANYRYASFLCFQEGETFYKLPETYSYSDSNLTMIYLFPVSEYNRLTGETATLNQNEILLYSFSDKTNFDTLTFAKQSFQVKQHIDRIDNIFTHLEYLVNAYYIIMPDQETILKTKSNLLSETEASDGKTVEELSYFYGFDTNCEPELQTKLVKNINNTLDDNHFSGYAEGVEQMRDSFYSLYGGFLFVGIFLGILFIMITVLIIYYKQISEGFDDRERFIIMQKVGMSRKEVKKAIQSQILTMFFLPLITACIHVAFAFPIIIKLLALLNLTNVLLFIGCLLGTILVFAILYTIVYALTAKVYYKIVC